MTQPAAVAEGLHPALAGAGGELGHLGPLAVVEPQVVERRRLDQQVELARGTQYRQIGEDRLDPSRGIPQLGLGVGITAALLDELLVIGERGSEQSLAEPFRALAVGELLFADLDQLVDGAAGEAESLLGLIGRWRSRRYADSDLCCSTSVFFCSRRTSAVLIIDAPESRINATKPAPTIDGCRRDQVRSRSAGVGRRARIGRPSRKRFKSSASSCAVP